MPVGLFKSEVSKRTALTPRQGSQIDLWQIERTTFRIFELKDFTNISVSIITELMYYANIFHNVFINRKINYPIDAFNLKQNKIFRSFNLITNALIENSITDIEAVFLAEKLHPLIEGNLQKILQDLNENSYNIIFSYKKVTLFITIEAKASEPFDGTIESELKSSLNYKKHHDKSKRTERITDLQKPIR